jgi:hypothetical protein
MDLAPLLTCQLARGVLTRRPKYPPTACLENDGLSPCWIARSLSGNAATGSKVVSGSRDRTPARMAWSVPASGAAVSMCQVPPTRSASSPKATGSPTFRAQPTLVVDADHVKEKGGSIGRALFHVDTRVVDDSERDVPTGQVGESRRPPGRQRRVA